MRCPTVGSRPHFPCAEAISPRSGFEGPAIGHALQRLEEHWLDGDFAASRETLLARAKAIAED